MSSIKICYENEIRRVPLREDGSAFTLAKLMNTLFNLFPALTGKNISLTWEDDEGDVVICSSDAELDDALRVMKSQGKVLRFTVKINTDSADPAAHASASAKPAQRINFVHSNVTCDECGVSPIVGIRYKCAIRNDFDLCEACEAKRIQPYPMIKIVDPAQAPQVLVYGLPDGTRNDEGTFWQRGWRHHPHGHPHHPPHHPPHPHPHGPPGGRFPPFGGPAGRGAPGNGEGGCRRRCGWARKLAENIAKEAAPFVAAMDNVFSNLAGEEENNNNNKPKVDPTSTVPSTSEEAQLEEQLIEKAILESLVINEEKPEEKKPVPEVVPPPTTAPYVETVKPANPALPKPALRFVKDATFPDGTIVQPGAKFRKAWKVRNDGNHSWPEGSHLVSVGGDIMGDATRKEPLPNLAPEKEAEIAVQLTAPQAPGMYTAYYRAQTKEQQYFGQRLWASIVVADQEPDWQVISDQKTSGSVSPAPTASPVLAPVSDPVPVPAPIVTQTTPLPVVVEVPPPAPAAVETPRVETVNIAAVPTVPATAAAVVEEQPPEPVPAAPPAHLRSAILLWRRELEILNEMGFSDPEVVLPLLQQHLGSPISLSGDKNARPNAEGMQQVIATLLSLTTF